MTQDVEKRWRDPKAFRSAVRYAATVIALALLIMAGVIIWSATSGDSCADAEFAVCTDPDLPSVEGRRTVADLARHGLGDLRPDGDVRRYFGGGRGVARTVTREGNR